MASSAPQRYSIIIPAHNEQETIGIVLEAACNTRADEIVVVDDGSADETASRVRRFCARERGRVKLVRHRRNLGYLSAHRTGVRRSRNDTLLFFDADVRNATASQMEKMVQPILAGRADYVLGGFENFGRITEYLARPLLRYFLPELSALRQPMSGLFAIRREYLHPNRFDTGYVILGTLLDAYFRGARITEVQIGRILHDKRPDSEKSTQANEECRVLLERLVEQGLVSVRGARPGVARPAAEPCGTYCRLF